MYTNDIYLSLQFVYYCHINLFNVLYYFTHVVSTDKEFELIKTLTNDNVTSIKQFVSAML